MRQNFTVAYSALAGRLTERSYYASFSTVMCGRDKPLYQPDGVHLNDDGRRTIAEAMGKLVNERYFGAKN
jgi:lysophospholipase L1-like esterase